MAGRASGGCSNACIHRLNTHDSNLVVDILADEGEELLTFWKSSERIVNLSDFKESRSKLSRTTTCVDKMKLDEA